MYRKRDTTSQYRFRLAQISPIQEGIVDIFSRLSVRLSRSLPTGKLLFPDRSLQKQTVLMFSFFCFFCCLFLFYVFEPASSAHTTKAQTKLRQPQYLRAASTAEQLAIGPAQNSKVHTAVVVRSCRPERYNTRKQTRPSVVESHHVRTSILRFLLSSLLFFE